MSSGPHYCNVEKPPFVTRSEKSYSNKSATHQRRNTEARVHFINEDGHHLEEVIFT